jgi:stage II sporulation protein R
MLAGTCAALLFASFVSFAEKCEAVQGEVLRLHVLANSDSADDRRLKYELRDFILEDAKKHFAETLTLDEAVQSAGLNLPAIEQNAKMFIAAQGCDYDVTVTLENMYFTTRVYENITMPAGNYAALRVVIGAGEGSNWWCVVFPPLCLPAVTQKNSEPFFTREIGKATGSSEVKRIEVRFKVYEWFVRMFG